jgi:hypothetical protein
VVVKVEPHQFLTSAQNLSEWSASRPKRFTCSDRAPATHSVGWCVGPRVGLGAVEKRYTS